MDRSLVEGERSHDDPVPAEDVHVQTWRGQVEHGRDADAPRMMRVSANHSRTFANIRACASARRGSAKVAKKGHAPRDIGELNGCESGARVRAHTR
jgi:hypothetical protein